jgi:hypothetical protein
MRAVTTASAVSVFQRLAANSKGPGAGGSDTNLALVQQLQELKVRGGEVGGVQQGSWSGGGKGGGPAECVRPVGVQIQIQITKLGRRQGPM